MNDPRSSRMSESSGSISPGPPKSPRLRIGQMKDETASLVKEAEQLKRRIVEAEDRARAREQDLWVLTAQISNGEWKKELAMERDSSLRRSITEAECAIDDMARIIHANNWRGTQGRERLAYLSENLVELEKRDRKTKAEVRRLSEVEKGLMVKLARLENKESVAAVLLDKTVMQKVELDMLGACYPSEGRKTDRARSKARMQHSVMVKNSVRLKAAAMRADNADLAAGVLQRKIEAKREELSRLQMDYAKLLPKLERAYEIDRGTMRVTVV